MLLRDLQLPDDARPGPGRAAQAVPRRADGDGRALQPVAVPDHALLVQGDEGPPRLRHGRLHADPSLGEA